MITTRLPAARDRRRRDRVVGVDRPVGQRQELHGLVDARQLPARDRQVPGHGRADRQHHGVMPGPDVGGGDGRPGAPTDVTPHTNSVPSARI